MHQRHLNTSHTHTCLTSNQSPAPQSTHQPPQPTTKPLFSNQQFTCSHNVSFPGPNPKLSPPPLTICPTSVSSPASEAQWALSFHSQKIHRLVLLNSDPKLPHRLPSLQSPGLSVSNPKIQLLSKTPHNPAPLLRAMLNIYTP